MAGLSKPPRPSRAEIRQEVRELVEDVRLIRAQEREVFWRLPDHHDRRVLAEWRAREERRIAEAFRGRHG